MTKIRVIMLTEYLCSKEEIVSPMWENTIIENLNVFKFSLSLDTIYIDENKEIR